MHRMIGDRGVCVIGMRACACNGIGAKDSVTGADSDTLEPGQFARLSVEVFSSCGVLCDLRTEQRRNERGSGDIRFACGLSMAFSSCADYRRSCGPGAGKKALKVDS
jgi:hypothetical protein